MAKRALSSSSRPYKPPVQQAWTNAEELALASAWLEVTEDGTAKRDFWKRVQTAFHVLVVSSDHYRTEGMLTSKWRDIRLRPKAFNVIYKDLDNEVEDPDDIIKASKDRFKVENGFDFKYEDCSAPVRKQPKL
jgi:hypothetical protein